MILQQMSEKRLLTPPLINKLFIFEEQYNDNQKNSQIGYKLRIRLRKLKLVYMLNSYKKIK